jgi:hypothetical protein
MQKGFLLVDPLCGSLANTNKVQLLQCNIAPLLSKDNDETLPNFIKRKHPRKGEKKKLGAKHQSPGNKSSNRGGQQGNGTIKNQTLHQSHEAYQLKREEVNPIKLQA